VGKSSLIEAVSWALFGNESQIVRTSKDGIRSADAAPNEECSVLVEFDIGGDEYRLTRAMKGKDLKMSASLTVNGKAEATGDKAVTESVTSRLGMDHKAFFISVFARQKELNALSTLRPHERKKLILRMLDIDALDRVVADIDKDANRLKDELKGLERSLYTADGRSKTGLLGDEIEILSTSISAAEVELEGAKEMLEAALVAVEGAKAKKAGLASAEKDHRALMEQRIRTGSERTAAVRNLERIIGEIASLQAKREGLESGKAIDEEHQRLLQAKEGMEEHRGLFEEAKGLREGLTRVVGDLLSLDKGIEELRSKAEGGVDDDRVRGVEETLQKVSADMDGRLEAMTRVASETNAIRREVEALTGKMARIREMGPESNCPTCERPLGEHHPFLLGKLEEERKALLERMTVSKESHAALAEERERDVTRKRALERRLSSLREQRTEMAKAQSSLQLLLRNRKALVEDQKEKEARLSGIGDIRFSEEGYRRVRERLRELRPEVDQLRGLEAEVARLPALAKESNQLRKAIEEMDVTIRSIDDRLATLGYLEGSLEEASGEAEALMEKKEAYQAKTWEMSTRLQLLQGKMATKASQLSELTRIEETSKELGGRLEELLVLGQAMRDFRLNVMSRVVPALSEISSSLLSEMTDSKYGGMELSEDYDISVLDGGVGYPLERFSGGESDLANLSLRLAISKVISDRSGSEVNFLILDEIFGSQDQGRKRNVMATLNHLSRRFRQIVLITHIDDVKDLMNHVMVIKEREDGSSEVAVEN
jgi:exonuclease SbcC